MSWVHLEAGVLEDCSETFQHSDVIVEKQDFPFHDRWLRNQLPFVACPDQRPRHSTRQLELLDALANALHLHGRLNAG